MKPFTSNERRPGTAWPLVVLASLLLSAPAVAQNVARPSGAAEAAAAHAAEPLDRVRQLYNAGEYDEAIRVAVALLGRPGDHDTTRLLLGRALLERHRSSASPEDLSEGRQALRAVDPHALSDRDRIDLRVGIGEALYLDGEYGPAALVLATALDQASALSPEAREQLADWWATAKDRHAQTRPPEERADIYLELEERMARHLLQFPDSSAALYWSAASALARGALELAWDRAVVAWVQAPMTPDRGEALRADIDRLVVRALVPERVKRLPGASGGPDAANSLLAEWEIIKEQWTRR